MDSRLKTVDGQRLVHLLYSDAPRVAQALVDKMLGRAKLSAGVVGTTPYLEITYPGVYSVLIRGDDWKKIFPLIRYGSGTFQPVLPPAIQPDPILSPQPNRTMQPPPVNPGDGFTSFLAFFTWDEYLQLQRLLTMSNVSQQLRSRFYKPFDMVPDPVSINPPTRRTDQSGMPDVYDRLVGLLQLLFPKDFPTSQV
jgi:hypothetical protein